jgi:cytochrome b6-f complex iron-sulfur subunit
MERKDFLKFLTAGVATGSIVSYLASCSKSDNAPHVDFNLDLSLPSNSALLQSGGSVISNQVIIINNNGTYVALSDICTHAGCALSYNNSNQKLNCPCHGASFNLSGNVLSGPANQSLKQYSVTKSGNTLHISG